MINHQHKCIYIHIPRTGGSFIEKIIQEADQWKKNPKEKHLIASQAKALYKEYWDEYFKFSFVRDPWARAISSTKFPRYFKMSVNSRGLLDLGKYKEFFGYPLCLEHDWRFSSRKNLIRESHLPNTIYLNMLDEELDFVGKYENMEDDLNYVLSKIGLNKPFIVRPPSYSYEKYYTPNILEEIRDLYREDIKHFQYNFGTGGLVSSY